MLALNEDGNLISSEKCDKISDLQFRSINYFGGSPEFYEFCEDIWLEGNDGNVYFLACYDDKYSIHGKNILPLDPDRSIISASRHLIYIDDHFHPVYLDNKGSIYIRRSFFKLFGWPEWEENYLLNDYFIKFNFDKYCPIFNFSSKIRIVENGHYDRCILITDCFYQLYKIHFYKNNLEENIKYKFTKITINNPIYDYFILGDKYMIYQSELDIYLTAIPTNEIYKEFDYILIDNGKIISKFEVDKFYYLETPDIIILVCIDCKKELYISVINKDNFTKLLKYNFNWSKIKNLENIEFCDVQLLFYDNLEFDDKYNEDAVISVTFTMSILMSNGMAYSKTFVHNEVLQNFCENFYDNCHTFDFGPFSTFSSLKNKIIKSSAS